MYKNVTEGGGVMSRSFVMMTRQFWNCSVNSILIPLPFGLLFLSLILYNNDVYDFKKSKTTIEMNGTNEHTNYEYNFYYDNGLVKYAILIHLPLSVICQFQNSI